MSGLKAVPSLRAAGVADILADRLKILQDSRLERPSRTGDVDCAVVGIDRFWPLRLRSGWRLCQRLQYDVRSWYCVLEREGEVLCVDVLDDPRGLGRDAFPSTLAFTEDGDSSADADVAAPAVRAAYLTVKRLRKRIRTDAQWRIIASLAREDPEGYRRTLAATLGATTAEQLATSVLESDGAPPEWLCRRARRAAGAVATRLPTDAGTGTLVDSSAASYRATQHVRAVFGEEPVVVLAAGDLQRLVLTSNLFRLLRLEGCLSGKVPQGAKPIPGPCAELARLHPVEFLAGPATFLNEAVIQIDEQLRRLAARVPPDQLREFLLSVAVKYGVTSVPSLSNPNFLATVVFDLSRSRGTPKARLAYLFPNSRSAQIVIRLRPGLSEAERHRALGLIREAVFDTTPRRVCAERGRPAPCFELHGGRYVVSGAPVVVDGLARALKDALLVLLGVAIAVMALTLVAVFRSRFRLLPLAIALAAAGLTFGLLGLVGGSLTMASIAVLPILIGLAVDYAIQLQARYDEAVASGAEGAEAARAAAASGGPAIAAACLATGAGFLALQLSPTPMVRSFGLLLVVGVAIAFALALTAGFAALGLRTEAGGGGTPPLRPSDIRGRDSSPWRWRTRSGCLVSAWCLPSSAGVWERRSGPSRTSPSSLRRASARCAT